MEQANRFVKVLLHNDEEYYIRKQTAVWLFQESERLSSDRLFRVRAKMPGESKETASKVSSTHTDSSQPTKSEYIVVGDLCAFKTVTTISEFKIGKVLQFTSFDKKEKRVSYKGNYANTQADCGVMCTWYEREENTQAYQLAKSADGSFHNISTYVSTLSKYCIEDPSVQPAQFGFKASSISTERIVTLTKECIGYIEKVKAEAAMVIDLCGEESLDNKPVKGKRRNEKTWVKCSKTVLTMKDKNVIQNGSKLTDIQINVSQQLLKKQFSCFNGFQFTLYQHKKPLENKTNAIQILNVEKNHWAVMSTVGCMEGQIKYYDSVYSGLFTSTEKIIAQLMSLLKTYVIEVEIMDTPKQSRSIDCGMFAIAICTALVYGSDPQQSIFIQSDMRPHLIDCIQQQSMKEFPVKQKHRSQTDAQIITVHVCPKCEKPDDGTLMVQCKCCEFWFHECCTENLIDLEADWLLWL